MDKFLIEGGTKLNGEVTISGAKNAALPILAATILADGEHIINNVPEVNDVRTMRKLLAFMGAKTSDGSNVHIEFSGIKNPEAPYELVKTMRASSMVLGPLLAKTGKAKVSLPGGCTIGARPLNLHIEALKAMGAKIKLEHGYIEATAKKLRGAEFYFDTLSVTGTENIMMAATLAQGTTRIENAAKEPEVVDLANFLIKMGADINGHGTDVITINGVESLKSATHTVIPDRIEAGTFLIAGALPDNSITINGCTPNHLEALVEKLRSININIERSDNQIRVRGTNAIKATNITTLPFPGFATDLQAQFMTLMSIAKGTSIVTETIFENRFQHVAELKRLGADITIEGSSAIVKGVDELVGAQVMATDLRASASLILAALIAKGTTEIQRIYHIDRGYEHIESKLNAIGAKITRKN